MKKIILSISIVLTTITLAQKKEVGSAFKALENSDINTASSLLTSADGLLKGNVFLLDPEVQEQYYYAKGIIALKQGKTSEGAAYLSKISELGKSKIYTGKDAEKNRVYFVGKASADASGISGLREETFALKLRDKLIEVVNPIFGKVSTEALEAYNSKRFVDAGKKFEESYHLLNAMGQNNGQLLYNAGLSYIYGKQNDRATAIFKQLIEMNYTGVETNYTAKEKSTGKIVHLDKATWEIYKKTQEYTDFKVETTPSIEAQLYETYAQLLLESQKYDEAVSVLSSAMVKFPNNTKLSELQSLVYHKAGRTSEFVASLKNNLQKDPKNATNWFNLGVMLGNSESSLQEAKDAYLKAISLDPKMDVAYQNLGNLIIGDDQKAIDEYNALRKSGKGNEANKVLELRRERFKQALPYLEKAYEINPNSLEIVTILKGLYQSLKEEAKFKELKAREETLSKGS